MAQVPEEGRAGSGFDDGRERLVADGLCTVNEALQFWGVKKSLVYSLMERGEIPYVRIGRRRLIPRRFLVQFAAENLVERRLEAS